MIKFQAVYMSGETRKADSTDYIDYYRAENGMIIEIVDVINTACRFYRVYLSESDKAAKNVLESFSYLNEAKRFCDTWNETERTRARQRIARGLYDAALDMDFGDYIESREEDVARIEAALEKLNLHDINDSALFQALERVYT